ncbi:MFS transporter [Georgenia satyanarayanai]|uniref:MFS transporter n=1 Tax=Georgenia satyanarayanai TaxID=860221 RepID=UPI002040D228|nr:MFS transporter [Georgenia satyanarayanai]MCM3662583.1 MFS transporter [Georgenia satyanarayanai]
MTARAAGRGEPMFPMRPVVLGAFVPSLVFEIGIGAMLPIVPLTATGLGASLAVAGVMAALLPIGQLLADVPAGALSARLGDRGAMLLAGLVASLGFVGLALAPNLALLAVSVLVIGAANAVFNLARHAYLTEITPPLRRARVLSTLAGVHRIGLFIGPFAGAAVIHGADVRAGYWLALGTSLVATAVVAAVRSEPGDAGAPARRDAPPRRSMHSVLLEHRQVFATLGIAVLLVGAVRGARQTVLPLWTEHLGLDPAVTSIVFGIAGAADMLLFYPAGKVMDSFGRLWIGVPAMLTMGVAMALLPLTTTLGPVIAVAVLLGLGNGMSSGILMTLGADTAPPGERAQFLGIWRVFQDGGAALGPLVVSGGAALGSLAAGIWVMAAGGGLATAALARWVPRWSVHATRTTRRRAGLL